MNVKNDRRYKLGNQGFIKGVLTVFIIGLGIFIIISFAMPYYRHNILTSYAETIVEADSGHIKKIRERVMSSANELKVPLHEENLTVESYDGKTALQANWTEVVDFWGFYQKSLYFKINIEQ